MVYKSEEGEESSLTSLRQVLAKKGVGDCDDYATLEFSLLRYAGFPEKDITFLAADFLYNRKKNDGDDAHAAAVIKIDEKLYLMDLNFDAPTLLNDDLTAKGYRTYDNIPQLKTVKIENPIIGIQADGSVNYYPQNDGPHKETNNAPLGTQPARP